MPTPQRSHLAPTPRQSSKSPRRVLKLSGNIGLWSYLVGFGLNPKNFFILFPFSETNLIKQIGYIDINGTYDQKYYLEYFKMIFISRNIG